MARTNGFVFENAETKATTGRVIPGSVELIQTCNQLALDAIKSTTKDKALSELATKVQSGDHAALAEFVDKAVEVPDGSMLEGASADELSRLLESRRSDRSKAKKTGLTTMDAIRRYISAWIAELVIRQASGKEYKAQSTIEYGVFESTDAVELTKKIKSLQSKKCRLNASLKMLSNAGATNPALETELQQVEAEIVRLNAMRGTPTRTSRVKAVDVVPTGEQLRDLIMTMSDEEKAALMAQLAG